MARAVLIRTKRNVYRDKRPVAERYFDAARGLDVVPGGQPPEVFVSMEYSTLAERFLQHHRIGNGRTLVALVPGAAHATKEWPEHHWVTLASLLAEQRLDLV